MPILHHSLAKLVILLMLALGVTPMLGGPTVAAGAAASCQFVLGFQTLHDMIPDIIGDCISDELHNPDNGDGLQLSTRGMMVWRKIDNNTAFTDGTTTWVNGPLGLQKRPNYERFPWEAAAAAAAPATQPSTSPLAPLGTDSTPPLPPPSAQAAQSAGGAIRTAPEQVLLNLDDVGKLVYLDYRKSGSDSRGKWAEVRFVREEQMVDQGLGPTKIVNRVYIANDVDAAQAIYSDELDKQNSFPEAVDKVAEVFVNDGRKTVAKVGDAVDSRGACSVPCDPKKFNHRLHERTIVRSQNAVLVLYYWGRDEFGAPGQINEWIALNMQRL